jgi:YebC/PmpR family DNA-binding regulatory protein
VAIMVDALTDNRNRTAPEIRKIFEKKGGSMGTSGCVSYMFSKKGVILVNAANVDEDELMELALGAGADDMVREDDIFEISCSPEAYNELKSAIDEAGVEVESAELSMMPQNTITVDHADTARKILDMMEMFEDQDDVQNVYSNFDIPDKIIEQLDR